MEAESAKKRGRKKRSETGESGDEDRSKNKSSLKIRKSKNEKQAKNQAKNNEIEVLDSEMEEKSVEILGLKKEANGISFYVKMNGEEVWVDRGFLVKNYADDICRFYEDRIVFEWPPLI